MTRRSLLGMLVLGASMVGASVVAIPAFLMSLSPVFQSRRQSLWRSVGRLEDYAIGAMHEGAIAGDRKTWPHSFREQAVFIWRRTEADLVVFSRSCTDLGCPLDYDHGSACFFCACHGGVFAQDGGRLAGPPNKPMHRYVHRVRDGMLEIDVTSLPPAV